MSRQLFSPRLKVRVALLMVTSEHPSVKVKPCVCSVLPEPVTTLAICVVSPMQAIASPVTKLLFGTGGVLSITFTLAVSEPLHPLSSVTVTFIIYSPLQLAGVGIVAVMLSVVDDLVWVVGVAKVTPGELTFSHVYE